MCENRVHVELHRGAFGNHCDAERCVMRELRVDRNRTSVQLDKEEEKSGGID